MIRSSHFFHRLTRRNDTTHTGTAGQHVRLRLGPVVLQETGASSERKVDAPRIAVALGSTLVRVNVCNQFKVWPVEIAVFRHNEFALLFPTEFTDDQLCERHHQNGTDQRLHSNAAIKT